MSGKGDKPRPIPDRKQYEDNWDAIFGKKDDMWEHYCTVEATKMSVGKGEECNWCGMTEK